MFIHRKRVAGAAFSFFYIFHTDQHSCACVLISLFSVCTNNSGPRQHNDVLSHPVKLKEEGRREADSKANAGPVGVLNMN